MSLRVTIDAHPAGDPDRRQRLTELTIGNLTALAPVSNYGIWVGTYDGRPPDLIVRRHRRAHGAVTLVARALDECRQAGLLP